jgi:hypothetical protein
VAQSELSAYQPTTRDHRHGGFEIRRALKTRAVFLGLGRI